MATDHNSKQLVEVESAVEKLDEIFKGLVPWGIEYENSTELLKKYALQKKEEIETYLDGFYLFKVGEISVPSEDNTAELIYKRHQSVITAAYQSGYTVATIIAGNGGGCVDIFMAVQGVEKNVPVVFESLLKGVFPGKGMFQKQEKTAERVLKSHLNGKKYGGIITGVPTMKIDGEKQVFDISSVIRSMNDKEYLLTIISRPVSKIDAANKIKELMKIKDICHSLTNRTVGMEESQSENGSESFALEKGFSETIGKAVSGGGNVSKNMFGSGSLSGAFSPSGSVTLTTGTTFPVCTLVGITGTIGVTVGTAITAGGGLTFGGNANVSKNSSNTESNSQSETETKGWSKTVGKSLSFEQQNSLAIELENIASKLITRVKTGLNNGLWENYISFATPDETSARILTGSFCGELIKGNSESLPVKTVSHELCENMPFIIPKEARVLSESEITNRLCSYMSSDELSLLMSLPVQSVPGFDIKPKPKLSLTDNSYAGFEIGKICEHGSVIKNSEFKISHSDIRKHIFVSGLTGSGKTTTVKEILDKSKKPFLVLESAKREYRRLLSEKGFCAKNLTVYTVGETNVAPLCHNPFWIMPGVSVITHIDYLKSIFNASFSLYGPMPYILEKCLANIYRKKGWNLTTGEHKVLKRKFDNIGLENESCKTLFEVSFHNRYLYPTLIDLRNEVNNYVKTEMEYKGELQDNIRTAIIARLDSLSAGAKGFLFNTREFIDIENLLKNNVVFELESLSDDDDKAFFVGLMLTLISEYRQSLARNCSTRNDNDELKHILVIEEAHRLLKNVQTERTSEMIGNPKGKAVETFCNIISEMRSMGQGIIVAEQIPTKISPDVIKNTNTKIIHRLVSYDEQLAVGAGLGLSESDSRYLSQLSSGGALIHKEGMSKPVEIAVNNRFSNNPVDDIKIKKEFIKKVKKGIEDRIELHESGLLYNDCVFAIAIRMVNSLFLSRKKFDDLRELAIKKVELLFEYPPDKRVISGALEESFYRVLFSQTYALADKNVDSELAGCYDRLWNDNQYMETAFIKKLAKWAGLEDIYELVYKRVEILILKEHLKTKKPIENIIKGSLLLNDEDLQLSLVKSIKGEAND